MTSVFNEAKILEIFRTTLSRPLMQNFRLDVIIRVLYKQTFSI